MSCVKKLKSSQDMAAAIVSHAHGHAMGMATVPRSKMAGVLAVVTILFPDYNIV